MVEHGAQVFLGQDMAYQEPRVVQKDELLLLLHGILL